MKHVLIVFMIVTLSGVFTLAPTELVAAPERITCSEGQKTCQGRATLGVWQTRRFVGKCPERLLQCIGNIARTTVPADVVCKSAGSKDVTCTLSFPLCPGKQAFCDCTNWAYKPNDAVATVIC